jgi:flagellar hook-associated protein 2
MAVGTLGMTGGQLTQDKIDKLKAVDVRLQLDPINKRATNNTKKQNALESFVTKLSLAKGSTSSLSDDATYLKRSASTTNSAVSVKVDAGVKAQSISLEVNQLAQQHVMQSRSFSSTESQVSFTDTTFDFNVNGNDYSLEVSGGTTLSEMAQLINDLALSDITASVIDTGNGKNKLKINK